MTTFRRLAGPLMAALLVSAMAVSALAQTAPPPPADVLPPPPPPPPPPAAEMPPPPVDAQRPPPPDHSQERGAYASITYQLSFPFGNTYQYAQVVSWRGLGLDLEWMVSHNIAAGFLFAWNVFYVNTNQLLHVRPGLDVSGGSQDRSINAFPMMLDLRYQTGEKDKPRLFLGSGIGGEVLIKYIALGLSSTQTTTFAFALAPELGILIPIQDGSAIQFEARYNVAFPSGGTDLQNWLSLNLGIAWGSAL